MLMGSVTIPVKWKRVVAGSCASRLEYCVFPVMQQAAGNEPKDIQVEQVQVARER
jgi:hypothetical protein